MQDCGDHENDDHHNNNGAGCNDDDHHDTDGKTVISITDPLSMHEAECVQLSRWAMLVVGSSVQRRGALSKVDAAAGPSHVGAYMPVLSC